MRLSGNSVAVLIGGFMRRPVYDSVIVADPGVHGGRGLLLHHTGSIWGRLLAGNFLDGSRRYFAALRSSGWLAGRNVVRKAA